MKKNTYSEWSNEKLLKSRNSLKGASIGLGIVALIAIIILFYLFFSEGLKQKSFAVLLPVFLMPITFLPVFISFSQMDKEIKSRNLK
jgi:hypothetical protein